MSEELAELLRRSIDIQHRMVRIRREEQREAVCANFEMCVVVRVRAGDVEARQINADVRHLFTVAEEVRETR